MRYSYSFVQHLPYSRREVFLFLCDPANLPLLMPAWQKARLQEMHLKPPALPQGETVPLAWRIAGRGSEITLSFHPLPLLPLRTRWTARIEEFHWGHSFVDVQTIGPFAYWKHHHTVRDRAEGGSTVIDEIEYIPPAKKLGHAMNEFLARRIKRTFAERQEKLAKLLSKKLEPNKV